LRVLAIVPLGAGALPAPLKLRRYGAIQMYYYYLLLLFFLKTFIPFKRRVLLLSSVCLSIRPSVCPSHLGTVSKRCKLKSQYLHRGLP